MTHADLSSLRRALRHPVALAFLVFVCRLALALAIVPPWQNGDEPSHVATAAFEMRHRQPGAEGAIERDILASMADHRWWALYERPTPDPIPTRFMDVLSVERRAVDVGESYYAVVVPLLRRWVPTDVTAQMYAMRAMSALMGFATFWCGWAAARLCVPEPFTVVPVVILALHPQFALVSTTATPDMVLHLCGAVIWWQAMRLRQHPTSVTAFAALWGAALIAALTRRVGLLLLPVAAATSTVMLVAAITRRPRRDVLVVGSVAAVVAGTAIGVLVLDPGGALDRALAVVRQVWSTPPPARIPRTWEFVAVFTRGLFDSAWLVAGWSRYPAPRLWLDAIHVLTVVATIGSLRALWRGDVDRVVLATAMCFAGLLVATVYAYHLGLMNGGASGRYLFPAAAPMSVLLWFGVRSWWPEREWGKVAIALVTFMAMFDIISWLDVLIPVYL